ncbi:MAG: sensor histidine kinase [Acidothermaceae bacterium]
MRPIRQVLPAVVPATLLGVAALTESAAHAAADNVSAQAGLVLCLLALATTLPLLAKSTGGAAVAITVASMLSLVPFHRLTIAGACAQLLVSYRVGRRDVQPVAGLLFVPFLVLAFAAVGDGETWVLAVLLASLTPAAAWAGAAARSRREAFAHTVAREAIVGSSFEHAARGERARIARELHDVVAHHISMVAVQAETARLATPGMPAAGAQRLSAIGDTARAALTEMRRLLGVLREDVGNDETVVLQPQPGIAQLNELLDEAREASGAGTRLIVRGSPVVLDPGVELAVYRIAQEALTNARRHAPGAAVDVELHYDDGALRLRVRDNGPGPSSSAANSANDGAMAEGDELIAGHGLTGMGERAAAVGGSLRTGAAIGGGFLVEAELPTHIEADLAVPR